MPTSLSKDRFEVARHFIREREQIVMSNANPTPITVKILAAVSVLCAIIAALAGFSVGIMSAYFNAMMPPEFRGPLGAAGLILFPVIAALPFLISTVGLLLQKPWTRRLLVIWSSLNLFWAVSLLAVLPMAAFGTCLILSTRPSVIIASGLNPQRWWWGLGLAGAIATGIGITAFMFNRDIKRRLKRVWCALENDKSSTIADAFKMRLLTAQRGGEVLSMRWADIDLKTRWWTIPMERSKNKMPHRVWLSTPVMNILKRRKEADGESPWVFLGRGATHRGDQTSPGIDPNRWGKRMATATIFDPRGIKHDGYGNSPVHRRPGTESCRIRS